MFARSKSGAAAACTALLLASGQLVASSTSPVPPSLRRRVQPADAVSASAARRLQTTPTPPNIIFLLADDLGYGELSVMPGRSNTNITTPNIDSLFYSGMRFTSAYANPVCAPSRASLMLGKHSGHSPIRGNYGTSTGDLPLGVEDITFLEALQTSKDYVTTCIGKWGLGADVSTGAPWLKGCNRYYGVLNQGAAHLMYPVSGNIISYDTESGVIVDQSNPNNAGASRDRCMALGNTCEWAEDMWITRTLDELDLQSERQANETAANETVRPFFLYWANTSPHAGTWTSGGPSGQPVPSDGVFASQPWPDVEKDHASTIQEYHDDHVGQIMSRLSSLGLRDNTVVIYMSDNGAHDEGGHDYAFFDSSGPLPGYKRWLADGGIRVPMAVSWPGVIPAAAVSDTPVAIWDVAPTVLSIAGVDQAAWPAGMDGISLFEDLLLPGAPSAAYSHPPLYWEFCTSHRFPRVTRTGAGCSRAVRFGDWKAIWQFDSGAWSGIQLFNITEDITESYGLATQNPDVVTQLEAIAEASHVDNPLFPRTDGCSAS